MQAKNVREISAVLTLCTHSCSVAFLGGKKGSSSNYFAPIQNHRSHNFTSIIIKTRVVYYLFFIRLDHMATSFHSWTGWILLSFCTANKSINRSHRAEQTYSKRRPWSKTTERLRNQNSKLTVHQRKFNCSHSIHWKETLKYLTVTYRLLLLRLHKSVPIF